MRRTGLDELFRNWSAHLGVLRLLPYARCPRCGSKRLGWLCCGLDVEEAAREAEAKYREGRGGE